MAAGDYILYTSLGVLFGLAAFVALFFVVKEFRRFLRWWTSQ